jgi:xanthine dehydrogenase accessory factor
MAILPTGQIIGSIGGGCSEAEVMRKAIDIIRDGGYCIVDVDLTDAAEEDGMVCGGAMKVLIEAV